MPFSGWTLASSGEITTAAATLSSLSRRAKAEALAYLGARTNTEILSCAQNDGQETRSRFPSGMTNEGQRSKARAEGAERQAGPDRGGKVPTVCATSSVSRFFGCALTRFAQDDESRVGSAGKGKG